MNWYVADLAAAEADKAALMSAWPGADVVVRVGVPSPLDWAKDGGVWERGDVLQVRVGEVHRTVTNPADARTRVELARALTRPMGGVVALPDSTITRHVPADSSTAWTLAAGPGFGVQAGGAPVHLALSVVGTLGDAWAGGTLLADIGSSWPIGVQGNRWGAGALAGLRVPLWSGHLEWGAGVGARLRTLTADGAEYDRIVPALYERETFSRHLGPTWEASVGLLLELDDPARALTPATVDIGGQSAVLLPGCAALEIGVGRRAEGTPR